MNHNIHLNRTRFDFNNSTWIITDSWVFGESSRTYEAHREGNPQRIDRFNHDQIESGIARIAQVEQSHNLIEDAIKNRPEPDCRVVRMMDDTYYNIGGSRYGYYYAHQLKIRNGRYTWVTDYRVSQDDLQAMVNAPEGLRRSS